MTVRNDILVEWWRNPRIILVGSPSTEVTVQDLIDTLRNIEDEPSALAHPHLINAAGKEELGGGVLVGITAELQNARLGFQARPVPTSTGQVTTGNPAGQYLIDAAGGFISDSVSAGDWVVNKEDGSAATVLEVNSDTQLECQPLDGGLDDQWDIGDDYQIYKVIQCNISGGNLVATDADGNALDPVFNTALTQVIRTASSSATLQEQEALEYSSFNGGVTVDTTSPYTGALFPVGTPRQPVNNLVDALSIATERGFTTLFVIGNITLDSGLDYSWLQIIGESQTKSEITIDAAANVLGSEFYDAYIQGTLDGNAKIVHCRIDNLTYVSGYIEQCILDPGTIVLSGASAHFLDCWSGVPGAGTPTIDMGGSGTSLALRNYNGGVKLINKSGADAVSIDLNSGQVILDATVTGGTITIRGIGKITDNSVGATVNVDNLLQGDALTADAVWDEPLSEHTDAGSTAEALQFLMDIEGGRWRIISNQMIFYKADNITEIARFNLFDLSGTPSQTDVFQRERV